MNEIPGRTILTTPLTHGLRFEIVQSPREHQRIYARSQASQQTHPLTPSAHSNAQA